MSATLIYVLVFFGAFFVGSFVGMMVAYLRAPLATEDSRGFQVVSEAELRR